ncbi:lytic transglycosylase domain-containing protein [Niveibacterium sp. SC-1]|uniref:lytic transglycosylase domain-containing protein n=1 Tax=Niveibacterium sp. SC-1 TaxID=3135646 RepID=UPI00311EBD33
MVAHSLTKGAVVAVLSAQTLCAFAGDGIIALPADDENAPPPADVATAAAVLHGTGGGFVDVDPAYGKKTKQHPKGSPPPPQNASGTVGAPTAQHATCTWESAGQKHGVSPYLLYAIAKTESSLNPRATNRNGNGSEDVGLMQINSVWLPTLARYGITRADLFDGVRQPGRRCVDPGGQHAVAWGQLERSRCLQCQERR